MNSSQTFNRLEKEIKNEMHSLLMKCSPGQRELFHRMYNFENKHIRDVDAVPIKQWDRAFYQIEQTLARHPEIR